MTIAYMSNDGQGRYRNRYWNCNIWHWTSFQKAYYISECSLCVLICTSTWQIYNRNTQTFLDFQRDFLIMQIFMAYIKLQNVQEWESYILRIFQFSRLLNKVGMLLLNTKKNAHTLFQTEIKSIPCILSIKLFLWWYQSYCIIITLGCIKMNSWRLALCSVRIYWA